MIDWLKRAWRGEIVVPEPEGGWLQVAVLAFLYGSVLFWMIKGLVTGDPPPFPIVD